SQNSTNSSTRRIPFAFELQDLKMAVESVAHVTKLDIIVELVLTILNRLEKPLI
ncbi:36037_t:CDS:1, partial [Gigaspora margarita]